MVGLEINIGAGGERGGARRRWLSPFVAPYPYKLLLQLQAG